MHTTTGTTIITALAVAGVALGLSSCGDDAEALSKPDFVAQADAICEQAIEDATVFFDEAFAGAEETDFEEPGNELSLHKRFSEAMVEVTPIMEQQIDDLRELAAPEGDEELVDAMLDDLNTALDEFVVLIDAAADGDQEALRTLEVEEDDPFYDVNRRARKYGLTTCGEDG